MIHRLINVHSVIPNSRREKDSNITFLYAVLEIWVNIAFLCHIGSHFEHHVTYDTYLNIVIVQTSSFDDHRKKCNQILHYQKNTCKRNCFLCCHLEYSNMFDIYLILISSFLSLAPETLVKAPTSPWHVQYQLHYRPR